MCVCVLTIGVEPCEDKTKHYGSFGVLIEWPGDDLKKVDFDYGCTIQETKQAVEALAKLHTLVLSLYIYIYIYIHIYIYKYVCVCVCVFQ